ncbi:MAG: hypothetical protein EOO00_00315, partial [Chitinophagaceae bacterium]
SMTLISEELHDNLGQLLGLVHMNLSRLEEFVNPEGLRLLDDSIRTTRKVIDEVRFISHGLNSELMQSIGLEEALERELSFLRSHAGIEYQLQVEGNLTGFPSEKSLLLCRIFQEIIHNVMKHAAARQVKVLIRQHPSLLTIRISDDGKGFELEAGNKSKSLGLKNIRSRAKLLQADLKIESEPGQGTTIHIEVPLIQKR